MEKRIADLSFDPLTISLIDRRCSLFIDPKSGSIIVDEGEGEGRMNGVIFSAANAPAFAVESGIKFESKLVLNYCGAQYVIGDWDDAEKLRHWANCANLLLGEKASLAKTRQPAFAGNSRPRMAPRA